MSPCDAVTIHRADKHVVPLCAPSLFIVGVGKCGTNALAEHLAEHPHVRGMNREVAWDPLETPPKSLVRLRNVQPNDTRHTWAAKHPKYAFTADVEGLAMRLRASYPSAKIALTLCDPIRLPWRRFLFLLTSALTRRGSGAGDAATYRSLVQELQVLNETVSTLFSRTFSLGCGPREAQTQMLLEALQRKGFGLLYGNGWLTPGPGGQAQCRQEQRLVMSYTSLVRRWTSSLGTGVNVSLGLVYMEGWAAHGPSYMAMLLRMLGLEPSLYPWHAVRFGQPVFENRKAKDLLVNVGSDQRGSTRRADSSEQVMPRWLPAGLEKCVRQCESLVRIGGMLPPWCGDATSMAPAEGAGGGCRDLHRVMVGP